MDDPTDTALGISAGVGIALCGICVLVTAWRQSKIRAYIKASRSDTEISKMVPPNTDPIVVQYETPEPPPADQF
jgi:hypothetical protein